MAGDEDYSGDLYGDLDLEDIDASQLEDELNEPPEPEPYTNEPAPAQGQGQNQIQNQNQAQNQFNYSQPPPAANNGGYDQGASRSGGFNSAPAFGGSGSGSGPGDAGGQDAGGLDRIKPNDMPDEGKMFIGGLNWETTDDGLRAYMSKYGEIDACTIMRDPSGRSRGFAFLTYTSPVSVSKVLEEVHHLDGKQIDPKRAIPKAEHEKTAKVFVGGLAPSVTSESLRVFLHQFGEVHDATVMFDRETGRSKGFAFATFANEESVPIAMDASGIELEGKQIEIKKAQPRGSGNLVKNFNGAPGGGGGGRFNNQQQGGMGMMGGGGGGGFDPNAMAMMYQNMMKNTGMGNMGMGFDPNAMAMMYQNMMKNMAGMNAPAINPNMAMRNGGMGGMMGGMGGMGGMGMGGMGGMGGGMGGMGMMGGNGMGMMGGNGMGGGGMGRNQQGGMGGRANPPNAPRGPAAMRGPGGGTTPTGASGSGSGSGGGGGAGAQRYSTQGNARAKPY